MSDSQKISIKVSLDREKLTAVRTFLERKNLKIEDEFEQFFDTLFKKHVPKDVQIYIEGASTPAKKAAKQLPDSTPKSPVNPAENNGQTPYEPPLPYNRFEQFKD